jgi:hypothetical protein
MREIADATGLEVNEASLDEAERWCDEPVSAHEETLKRIEDIYADLSEVTDREHCQRLTNELQRCIESLGIASVEAAKEFMKIEWQPRDQASLDGVRQLDHTTRITRKTTVAGTMVGTAHNPSRRLQRGRSGSMAARRSARRCHHGS